MIYISCFLISCFFFWLSEKCKSRIARNVLAVIAILIPCVLAGLRADTIGTDVKVYVEPIYNAAKESNSLSSYMGQSWFYIWRYKYVHDFEIGFTILVYVIEKITESWSIVLFFIHVFIVTPVYIGLRRVHKTYPIYFGMLVFYLMFYNASLNMMRQWMAMAFLFMGFSYLFFENKKKYCAIVVIACLFHISAVIGFVIMLIYMYTAKKREYIKKSNYKFGESMVPIKIFCYGSFLLLSLNFITTVLRYIGFSKYIGYIQGDNGLYFLPNQIFLRLPIIILFIVRWKRIVKEDKLAPFYGSMIVLDLLSSQLMSINVYAFRISSFFSEYNMISYSALVYAGNRKYRANRYITILCVLAYILFYWTYYYVIMGTHATFPYIFA